ncbi:hypothetical protein QL285_045668 [Trifolium repens]|nr:hypothetical protein QL285_045668 [Trifolium repens]
MHIRARSFDSKISVYHQARCRPSKTVRAFYATCYSSPREQEHSPRRAGLPAWSWRSAAEHWRSPAASCEDLLRGPAASCENLRSPADACCQPAARCCLSLVKSFSSLHS